MSAQLLYIVTAKITKWDYTYRAHQKSSYFPSNIYNIFIEITFIYIIVSVIKEFSIRVVALTIPQCRGVDPVNCVRTCNDCCNRRVFYLASGCALHRFHTFSSHVWGIQVSCPPPAGSAPRRAPNRNARVERDPKRFTGHLIMGWRTQLRFVPLHKNCHLFHNIQQSFAVTWHCGICAVSVGGKALVENDWNRIHTVVTILNYELAKC